MVSLVLPKNPSYLFIWFSWKYWSWIINFNGIVRLDRFPVRSVCKLTLQSLFLVAMSLMCFQYSKCRLVHWLFNKDFDQQIQWIKDIDFVFDWSLMRIQFIIQDQDLCWRLGVDGDICVNLEFRNSLLDLGWVRRYSLLPSLLKVWLFFEYQVF